MTIVSDADLNFVDWMWILVGVCLTKEVSSYANYSER